jgi:hypothetical protein
MQNQAKQAPQLCVLQQGLMLDLLRIEEPST